jgi:hypothetical protein
MRLEELGSSISDNQFILHILNNMTDDYDLQLAMMGKRVTGKSNPLSIDEIRDNLNLRFKRLNEKQNEESENDNNQEVAFFGDQFKGKCRNCGAIGHRAKDCKLKTNQNGGQNSGNHNNFRNMQVMALTALIVVVQVILKAIVTGRKINRTVTVVQITMKVKDTEFFYSNDVAITADPWKG